MVESSFTNKGVVGSSPVAVILLSDMASEKLHGIYATTEYSFTVNAYVT